MSTNKKIVHRNRYSQFEKGGIDCQDPSLTKQSMKDDCDINNILKKFNKTGVLPDMIKSNPQYGDFSDARTYQESLNLVIFADEQFQSLSANTRKRFGNDPAAFLAFANDPSNEKEMISLGLATPKAKSNATSDPSASGEGSDPKPNTPKAGTA